MKHRLITLLAAALTLATAPAARADGMYIAPIGSFMFEPAQQAFIEWDAAAGTEALTILPAFYGDAEDFAWVVPVPGLPRLALADRQLFADLEEVTRTVYRSRDGQWNCLGEEQYDIAAPGADNGVEIISDETVGYYQTLILSATDAPALLDSLTAWGFLHEQNSEAVAAALTDYVDRSWYFVTLRVDSEALEDFHGTYYGDYYYSYYGGLDPITLTFPAEAPVYPMKISAYSAAASTSVNVYVKSSHRMTFPGAETYYANRFSTGELADLPHCPSLAPLLSSGDFLTKLRRGYTPAQMTEDVYFVPAESDQEFRLVHYSGWPVTSLLLLGGPVVWGVWRAGRRRRP